MTVATSKRLEGIGEYYFSQKLREIEQLNKQGRNIINLGIGSPDLPPHPDVIKVLQEEAEKPNTHAYQSYKGSPILRKAIADWYAAWYGVALDPETEVLPLIGSKEGIMHICMTYLNEGDEALIPNPGYPTYSSAVKLAGGKPVPYEMKEENNWEPDFAALEKTDLSKVKLLWVNYPHMPTGQLPTRSLFEKIVAFGKKHNILVCHDNPYSFILNPEPMSLLAMLKLRDVETFSTMFLNYDLLARRWPPYGYLYPFAELAAGVLMAAGILTGLAAPLGLFIGGVGAVSVFKAVYVDKRELKCACVGGDSNVPLGFVSLTENLMMIAMALWMLAPRHV